MFCQALRVGIEQIVRVAGDVFEIYARGGCFDFGEVLRGFESRAQHQNLRRSQLQAALQRLLARIDEQQKNWKLGLGDIKERKFWKNYMSAYEECLSATSTRNAPWYVVPADDKENARLIVSQIVLDTFEKLDLEYPETTPKRARELQAIRKELIK